MAKVGTLRVAAVVAAAVLTAALVAALVAPPPADAAKRSEVVTKTFSNSQPITIRDLRRATPYPSEIGIGGVFGRGRVEDVNLTLKNFSHEFEDDVDVLLVKGARNRTVMSDINTLSPTSDVTLVLDDEATNSFPAGTATLTSGTYKPANHEGGSDFFPGPTPVPSWGSALGGFDGMTAKGTWKLFVMDDFGDGEGQIAGGWSLKIKAKVPR